MIDSNTLYYFFSTIAQTLAAVFAFVSAFIFFKNQSSVNYIELLIRQGREYLIPGSNLDKLLSEFRMYLLQSEYDEILRMGKVDFPEGTHTNVLLSGFLIQSEVKLLASMRKDFKLLIWLCFPIIVCSILMISLTPILICYTIAIIIIMSLFIGLVIYVMIIIYRLLINSIFPPKPKES